MPPVVTLLCQPKCGVVEPRRAGRHGGLRSLPFGTSLLRSSLSFFSACPSLSPSRVVGRASGNRLPPRHPATTRARSAGFGRHGDNAEPRCIGAGDFRVAGGSPQTVARTACAPAEPAAAPAAQSAKYPARHDETEPVGVGGLRIAGYLQDQYQHNDLSEDQLQHGGSPLNQNQFVLRRGRVRIDRTWAFASGSLELDANTVRGPRIGIRRAEASLFYRGKNREGTPPLIMLTAGIIDIPFGFELLESARTRWFMDRTLGNSALFPTEMDVGVKLSGAVSFVRYAVAIMNGEPIDGGLPRDPNAAKDVIARLGAEGKLTLALEMGWCTSFAVGKGFHAGQDATKSSVTGVDFNEDGTHSPTRVHRCSGSAAIPPRIQAWAIGWTSGLPQDEAGKRAVRRSLRGDQLRRGFAPVDPVTTRSDARQTGGHLALTQELTRYAIVGFRASYYDPNSDIIEVRGGRTLPKTQSVKTLSPLAGFVLPGRARLLLQYDFIRDYLARDEAGVPSDADNNQWTLRLQVEL